MNDDIDRAVSADLVRVEEAGLNALQTQRQLFYDGWLLRLSPGTAKRARSVNPHFGSSLPLTDKIAYCEGVYARHALPLLFRMTPMSRPGDLDRLLAARGFEAFGETLVQTLAMPRPPDIPDHADEVVVETPEIDAFVDAVDRLRNSTPEQREAHRERLVNSPLIKRYALVRAGDRVVCTAQVAIDGSLVGVFDVITAPDARGKGYASLACASLLSWAWQHGANGAYLQVQVDNAPAIAAYRKFGFKTAYTYHYRGRPGQCE
ncbi:MAG TPA: GNAT family N-acetyltransferase [Casimicrobiaceae bacterium]|nr:GNAT family N-acetyltransferase [Casimicrobiaceae bacterium]